MSYTIQSTVHPIFQFVDSSITFTCSYPRSIEISDHDFDVNPIVHPDEINLSGSLAYTLDVNVAEIGLMSSLIISPKHNISDVVAT